jgi:hypothetical protein
MLTVFMQPRPIAHRPWRVIRRGVTNNLRASSRKSGLCSVTARCGIVSCKAEAASAGQRRKRCPTDLLVETGLLSQEALRGLVDDCLVPALVSEFLSSRVHNREK